MISPNAEQIEAAVDQIDKLPKWMAESQQKELHSAMSDPALEKLGVSAPYGGDFEAGYALGLQTARVVISQSAALILHGVKPEDVL